MPAMSNNDKLNDKDTAQILSYIHKAWNNNEDSITEKEVNSTQQKYLNRELLLYN